MRPKAARDVSVQKLKGRDEHVYVLLPSTRKVTTLLFFQKEKKQGQTN
jgi:hypothetical protein